MGENMVKRNFVIIRRLFKIIHSINRKFLPLSIVCAIVAAAIPVLNVVWPKYIIDEMTTQKRPGYLLGFILAMVLSNAALLLTQALLNAKKNLAYLGLQQGLGIYLGEHIMAMDYDMVEDPEIQDRKEKALYPINMQNSLNELIETIGNFATALFAIISFLIIIGQLSIWLVVGILAFNLLGVFFFRKTQQNFDVFYASIPAAMRKSMYYEGIASDYKFLKDIQIYQAHRLLLGKLKEAQEANVKLFNSVFSKNGKYEGTIGIISHLQLIFIYLFCIYKIIGRAILFGSFTMYINAATQLAGKISLAISDVVRIHQNCKYIANYLDFLDIRPGYEDGRRSVGRDQEFTIEFSHVSFRYPNQAKDVLQDVNVTIHSGDRISIVGMNGAGKTTFVKLLCRLYRPTEGHILLNGININEYSYREYTDVISAVFQDFRLFDFSFRDNIIFGAPGRDVERTVEQAGLAEKVGRCDRGLDQPISKRFDENGIELSGGEAQKLAIARAIYKNTPLIVLDEPTSALDPYSEHEIYQKFNEISQGKTVIYISHRLSSCLLSDYILVFAEGRIVEQGEHKDLKNVENGLYKSLWETQAKYYG